MVKKLGREIGQAEADTVTQQGRTASAAEAFSEARFRVTGLRYKLEDIVRTPHPALQLDVIRVKRREQTGYVRTSVRQEPIVAKPFVS